MRHFRIPDLRVACETRLACLGFHQEIRDAVLGRAQPLLQKTYNKHGYLKEKREALDAYATHVLEVEARAGQGDRGARHLKKGNGVLRARVPMKYAFIRAHREEFGVRTMCRLLWVHFSGFYAWLKEPLSHRAHEDIRQTELIRQAWIDSGKVYGYRKLTDDLRDKGEQISENRVARLASRAGIAAQVGYIRTGPWTSSAHL